MISVRKLCLCVPFFLFTANPAIAGWTNKTITDKFNDSQQYVMYGDSYSPRFAELLQFGLVCHPDLNRQQTVFLTAQSNNFIKHPSGLSFRIDKNEPITLDAGISYIASLSEMQLGMSKGLKINIEEYAEYYSDAEETLGLLFEQMVKGNKAYVRIHSYDGNVDFPVSLTGFTEAFKKLLNDCTK